MTQVTGRHYETLEPIVVRIMGDRIESVDPLRCEDQEVAELPYIAPGFFDIQVNGYNGVWFCSPNLTVDQVANVTQALLNKGIAQYFPTLITASFDALCHGFRTLEAAAAANEIVAAAVAGYHLEGPYIATEDGPRGAHPLQHVRPADYAEFSRLQEAANHRIRLVTLAPESPGAVPFIQACRRDNVMVSIGHTAATGDQIRAAVDAGATLSTHLGNGAHGVLPRHPNYIWEQLSDDRLNASIIADGWHLPAAVLKCFFRTKQQERLILTCDASGFAGCPPGVYSEANIGVEVLDDGRIVVAGQRQFLAGSGATTGDCVVKMADTCELAIGDAIRMASHNPANLMNISPIEFDVGTTGAEATLTIFRTRDADSRPNEQNVPNREFVPIKTIVRGRTWSMEP